MSGRAFWPTLRRETGSSLGCTAVAWGTGGAASGPILCTRADHGTKQRQREPETTRATPMSEQNRKRTKKWLAPPGVRRQCPKERLAGKGEAQRVLRLFNITHEVSMKRKVNEPMKGDFV